MERWRPKEREGSSWIPRSWQPSAVAPEIGTCTDPTITPRIGLNAVVGGGEEQGLSLGRSQWHPVGVAPGHDKVDGLLGGVSTIRCCAAFCNHGDVISKEDGVDVADGANLLHQGVDVEEEE